MTDVERVEALLAAERRGRALVQTVGVAAGDAWEFDIADEPDGHAMFVAARHAARFGARVSVAVARPSRPTPMWSILAAGCEKTLAVRRTGVLPYSSWTRIRGGEEMEGRSPPAADAAWRMRLDVSAPWVGRPVGDVPRMSCAQCREIDRCAIDVFAVPGVCLMENAAVGATAVAMDMLADRAGGGVLILAGGGNNGGDGLAMARGLCGMGVSVEVALFKPGAAMGGDAGVNLRLLRELPVPLHRLHGDAEKAAPLMAGRGLLVDGLLGTGFKGELTPEYRRVIDMVNGGGVPVLSLDLPSGLDGDSGEPAGTAVRAARTVTFAAVKAGLASVAAAPYVGDLFLADIGAPLQALGVSEA